MCKGAVGSGAFSLGKNGKAVMARIEQIETKVIENVTNDPSRYYCTLLAGKCSPISL